MSENLGVIGCAYLPPPLACAWLASEQSWRPVAPTRSSDGPRDVLTLGDLLYAQPGATAIPEQDWTQLLDAIAAGDVRALHTLYRRSHRLVFTLAARICGGRELAEEVTVDVFHDIWRRAGDYDASGGSVVGWIMMQARSRSIDRVRFEHRKKRVDPTRGVSDEPIDPSQPGDAIDANQRRRLLERALIALTPDERRAVETAFFAELSYAETAAHLDEPVGTVKTRVRSALAKLRKALAEEAGES